MKIFAPLYERMLGWSRHRHAPALLGGVSFFEAIVFPIPPEVMLAPMSLAEPKRAYWFATISLVASMLGMFVGYAIGHFAIELAMPLLERFGYAAQFEEIKRQAAENGFWLLLLAGFTPVPFKVFTLASGAIGMPLLPFFFGALIGRGKRVFLVAWAIRLGGAKAEAMLRKHIEPIGWVALVLLVGAIAYLVFSGGSA
ncbi:DedA family protein [Xanthomonadaceae bacterium JHOS43]|nr:DedA family protein [Xanthomonadaceae bacterium JHOS43]MCX7563912.1 DedA family protein [Xanthomonadaceae bacterium XH05]